MPCFLLLLTLPLFAAPSTLDEIRLRGATRLLALAREEVDACKTLHEQGRGSLEELSAAQRRLLDAELEVSAATPAAPADQRITILQGIELLEARRLAAAQTLAAAGSLGDAALRARRLAHQLAWIEKNHAVSVQAKPERAKWLDADRDRQVAKVRLAAVEEESGRVQARFKNGAASEAEVRAVRRRQIQAETALALAKERLRLAEK